MQRYRIVSFHSWSRRVTPSLQRSSFLSGFERGKGYGKMGKKEKGRKKKGVESQPPEQNFWLCTSCTALHEPVVPGVLCNQSTLLTAKITILPSQQLALCVGGLAL